MVEGSPILYSDTVKYLGVLFDSGLSFREHIRKKCKKATRLLMVAWFSMGRLWGPGLWMMKWMYAVSYTHLTLPTNREV